MIMMTINLVGAVPDDGDDGGGDENDSILGAVFNHSA